MMQSMNVLFADAIFYVFENYMPKKMSNLMIIDNSGRLCTNVIRVWFTCLLEKRAKILTPLSTPDVIRDYKAVTSMSSKTKYLRYENNF